MDLPIPLILRYSLKQKFLEFEKSKLKPTSQVLNPPSLWPLPAAAAAAAALCPSPELDRADWRAP